MLYFRDRIFLSGQPLTYLKGKSQLKKVTPTSFLSLISLKTVLTVLLAEKAKLGILDACVCKNIYIKEKLG